MASHLLCQGCQCRGDRPAFRVSLEDLLDPVSECDGALLGLVEVLPGPDRIGSQDLPGMVGLGGDAVDLRLVRNRGQPFLLHLLDPGTDFLLAHDQHLGRGAGTLVGLVELVHAGRAGIGFDLDLLEDLGVGDELLCFLQLLCSQRGVFLGQRLGLVEDVHDLEPAIPEPGKVLLGSLVEGQRLAGHGLLEVRVLGGQLLEPGLQSVEPVHDIDGLFPEFLDLSLDRVPGPFAGQPDQEADDQADGEQGNDQGQEEFV